MKKNILIELVEKIKRNNIKLEEADDILLLDEQILNSLARLDDDLFKNGIIIALSNNYDSVTDKIYAIESLKKLEQKEYIDYATKLLMDKNIIDAKLGKAAINLLNGAFNEFNAKYISKVLANEKILKDGLALKGAKEIQESSHEFNAKNIYGFLVNIENTDINTDIKMTLEGMNILNRSLTRDECKYAFLTLTEPNIIEAGITLEGAKIINKSKEQFNAKYTYEVLRNDNIIESGIALEGAKLIQESNNEFNAEYTYRVLKSKEIEDPALVLESAKIINESPNEFNAEVSFYILIEKKFIDAKISIPLAKIVNESPNKFNATCIEHLLLLSIDNDNIKSETLLKGAKLINESLNEFNAFYAYRVLNILMEEDNLSFESAKIINESPNEFNAECAFMALTERKLIDLGISLKIAKMINKLKNITTIDNEESIYKEYIKFIYEIIMNNLDIPLEKLERLLNNIPKEIYLQLSSLNSLELIKYITEQLHKNMEIDNITKIIYEETSKQINRLDNIINYLDTINDEDVDINTIINNNIIKPKSKVKKI